MEFPMADAQLFYQESTIKREDLHRYPSLLKLLMSPAYWKQIREHKRQARAKTKHWLASSPPDRLSAAEVKELSSYPWDAYEKDLATRRYVFTKPMEETLQGQTVPLMRHLIKNDSSLKKLVEIGCYYAYVCYRLAQEFPALQVIGVDFPSLLKRVNQEFARPNLEIIPGYALELMEAGTVTGDLYFTCSTMTRFKNLELKRYLACIKKHGKYLVINEPLFQLPGQKIVHPDTVSPDKSVPVFYEYIPLYLSQPPCFVHNYKAICANMGFSILHYHVYIPKFTAYPHYRIEMVAKG
jgi:hypothetical protein